MESLYPDMSNSEKQVARYLDELGLQWICESPIFVYDEKDRPRVWTPDFYIPKLGMHVECCGSDQYDYDYRDKIYKKNGYHVIFLHTYKTTKQWQNFLIKRITEIEEERHSEIHKMISHRIT